MFAVLWLAGQCWTLSVSDIATLSAIQSFIWVYLYLSVEHGQIDLPVGPGAKISCLAPINPQFLPVSAMQFLYVIWEVTYISNDCVADCLPEMLSFISAFVVHKMSDIL